MPTENALENYKQLGEATQKSLLEGADEHALSVVEQIHQLMWHWADLEITIENPQFETFSSPHFILPEKLEDSEDIEPVYRILDAGNKFSTSKAEEMFSAGMSMFKLYSTIEKMIYLLVERLKSHEGIDNETEVQISFSGNELAKRKAFESVINLNYNVVVVNFNPDAWGENYLRAVKMLADKGYGYPPESPRDSYRYRDKSKATTPGRQS